MADNSREVFIVVASNGNAFGITAVLLLYFLYFSLAKTESNTKQSNLGYVIRIINRDKPGNISF